MVTTDIINEKLQELIDFISLNAPDKYTEPKFGEEILHWTLPVKSSKLKIILKEYSVVVKVRVNKLSFLWGDTYTFSFDRYGSSMPLHGVLMEAIMEWREKFKNDKFVALLNKSNANLYSTLNNITACTKGDNVQ